MYTAHRHLIHWHRNRSTTLTKQLQKKKLCKEHSLAWGYSPLFPILVYFFFYSSSLHSIFQCEPSTHPPCFFLYTLGTRLSSQMWRASGISTQGVFVIHAECELDPSYYGQRLEQLLGVSGLRDGNVSTLRFRVRLCANNSWHSIPIDLVMLFQCFKVPRLLTRCRQQHGHL